MAGRPIRCTGATYAVPDHNVPTKDRDKPIADPISAKQVETLRQNCKEFGITLFDLDDERQGIVHVVGPEQGFNIARFHNRLWRLAYSYSRSFWSTRIRDWNKRSG